MPIVIDKTMKKLGEAEEALSSLEQTLIDSVNECIKQPGEVDLSMLEDLLDVSLR